MKNINTIADILLLSFLSLALLALFKESKEREREEGKNGGVLHAPKVTNVEKAQTCKSDFSTCCFYSGRAFAKGHIPQSITLVKSGIEAGAGAHLRAARFRLTPGLEGGARHG